MPNFAIIDAPSILGLRPSGVEHLPEALKGAGLLTRLNAEYAGRVEPPPFNPKRDLATLILNPDALKTYSLEVATAVTAVLGKGKFPRLCSAVTVATSSASCSRYAVRGGTDSSSLMAILISTSRKQNRKVKLPRWT